MQGENTNRLEILSLTKVERAKGITGSLPLESSNNEKRKRDKTGQEEG